MKDDLSSVGIMALETAESVDEVLQRPCVIIVNSICGCAAKTMRPAVKEAVRQGLLPDDTFQVFAGFDVEATDRARQYFEGYEPSSPAIAFVTDTSVQMIERMDIMGRSPEDVFTLIERMTNE